MLLICLNSVAAAVAAPAVVVAAAAVVALAPSQDFLSIHLF